MGVALHHLIIAYDLNSHLLISFGGVSSSDNIAEYSLARVAIHYVTFIQLLTDTNTIISFVIVPIVSQRWILIKVAGWYKSISRSLE